MRKWRKIDRVAKLAKRRTCRLANRDLTNARSRQLAQEIRAVVMREYGGKCTCCGETILAFLTIDHVNNNGAEHRRQLGKPRNYGGITFYRWLRAQGYPKLGYQVLCFNCNCAKQYSPERTCPHKHASNIKSEENS